MEEEEEEEEEVVVVVVVVVVVIMVVGCVGGVGGGGSLDRFERTASAILSALISVRIHAAVSAKTDSYVMIRSASASASGALDTPIHSHT